MSTLVFLGPTLPKTEAAKILDAHYLPPAAQGDMLAAYHRYQPRIVGLIDGYFQNVPAVLHKEILFLMDKGVHVLGASSMGALRAAELHAFGMIGVGQIFNAYKQDQLEDDDEVAVIHGPESLGFPALSEAMVNIRQTLLDAQDAHIIAAVEYEELLRIAKNMHYKERAYDLLFARAAAAGLPATKLARLREWLPTGRRDVKQEDAVALLHHIKNMSAATVTPKKVRYRFQNTIYWEDIVDAAL